MIQTQPDLTAPALLPKIRRMFELSAAKIRSIEQTWKPENGSPVCTVDGKYASRGWTEWTQGFQFGSDESSGGSRPESRGILESRWLCISLNRRLVERTCGGDMGS